LLLNAPEGKTKFSFQLPSTHDTDDVKEYNQKMHTPIVKENKPDRSAPCPCGGGKKYKQCHGKNK
jgi:preprotein translocase subunit SecA